MLSTAIAPSTSRVASRDLTVWLLYDFDLDAERLAESDELLLSTAVAVSVVVRLASRLADLLLDLLVLRDLSEEALTSSEADLSDDLLDEASRDAVVDLEALADRLASAAELLLDAD